MAGLLGKISLLALTGVVLVMAGIILAILAVEQRSIIPGLVSLILFIQAARCYFWLLTHKDIS